MGTVTPSLVKYTVDSLDDSGKTVGNLNAFNTIGSIIGTFVGVFVICLLKTGLPFIGLQANWQQIVTGFVLIGSVMVDIIKKRREKK